MLSLGLLSSYVPIFSLVARRLTLIGYGGRQIWLPKLWTTITCEFLKLKPYWKILLILTNFQAPPPPQIGVYIGLITSTQIYTELRQEKWRHFAWSLRVVQVEFLGSEKSIRIVRSPEFPAIFSDLQIPLLSSLKEHAKYLNIFPLAPCRSVCGA